MHKAIAFGRKVLNIGGPLVGIVATFAGAVKRAKKEKGIIFLCLFVLLIVAATGALYGAYVSNKHYLICPVQYVTSMTVDGILSTNHPPFNSFVDPIYIGVWDAFDLTSKINDDGLFIVTETALKIQNKDFCGEDPEAISTRCDPLEPEKSCLPGEKLKNGFATGNCTKVQSTVKGDIGVCEIEAWCPAGKVENPLPISLFNETQNFVVKFNIFVEFPVCGSQYSLNYRDSNHFKPSGKEDYDNCTYNEDTNPFCPNFRIGDIVRLAGGDFDERVSTGGVYILTMNWDCNFRHAGSESCIPTFKVEDVIIEKNLKVTLDKVDYTQKKQRLRQESTGIKLYFKVTGGGKLINLLNLVMALGSLKAAWDIVYKIITYIDLFLNKLRDWLNSLPERYRKRFPKYLEDWLKTWEEEPEVGQNLINPNKKCSREDVE